MCLLAMEACDILKSGFRMLALTFYRNERATEMDVTMIGLQNAGKSSLLRVLAVRSSNHEAAPELADRCYREASSLSSMSLSL
jgi:ABC-type phosphate/phosphonate transport system ATPase subunit